MPNPGAVVKLHYRHLDPGPNGEPEMEVWKDAVVVNVKPGDVLDLDVQLDLPDLMPMPPHTAEPAQMGARAAYPDTSFGGLSGPVGTWDYLPPPSP